MSETSFWLAIILTMLPLLIMFFKPTLLEFLAFYLIDLIAYMICQANDIRMYHSYAPRSRLFFPELDPALVQLKTVEEKKAVYQDILNFPRQRAIYFGLISAIKVIPGILFVILVWRGHDSVLMAFLKGVCVCAFTFSWAIGMSYLGYHNRASRIVQEVHERADWSEAFKGVDLVPHHKLFERFEIIAAISVWAFWTLVIVLIVTDPSIGVAEAVFQAIFASVAGLYFSFQLIRTSRKQIMEGLQNLMLFYNRGTELNRSKGLALSTNPTLAFYQRALNELIEKNADNEKEIHRWILRQAEDARYLQLGRITGLLVHDLLTPLTVMRYSLSVLDEQKAIKEQSLSYADRLRFSLDQITDFIKNIRASIRDQSHGYRQASLMAAHESALKMVSYLYDSGKFATIDIQCHLDPELKAAIPQPELNQVLLNLYSNAAKNLLENRIAGPQLQLSICGETKDAFTLVVKDNGTGLAAETFDYITEEAERLPGQEGIGLKLTKRLVELYGGSLKLVQPLDQVGSEFHLQLRKAEKSELKRPGAQGRNYPNTAPLPSSFKPEVPPPGL